MGKNFVPPTGDNQDNLGKVDRRWKNLYLAGNLVCGSTSVSINDLKEAVDRDEFIELIDTPSSYSGNSGKVVAVKSTEDGVEFISKPVSNIYVATGNTDISTNSTTFVDMPDMSITETFESGKILIIFNAVLKTANVIMPTLQYQILIDGVVANVGQLETSGYKETQAVLVWMETVTEGSHTIKVQWRTVDAGTIYQKGSSFKRVLTVITGQ